VRKRWALRHRVPLGSITILAGAPKQGKSTWTLDLAAKLSRGEADGDLYGEPAASVILSYEDDFGATLVPRLIAAGADLSQIHLLEPTVTTPDGDGGLVTLSTDLDRIAEECERVGARLLVIDPLMAALAEGTDSHRDQAVRRALAPVGKLAELLDLAALVISHTNKGQDGDLIRRIGASVGLTGAARSLMLMGSDPRDPQGADGVSRVLVSRGNLAPPVPALTYELESTSIEHDGQSIDTSRLVSTGEADVEPHELLAPPEPASQTEVAVAKDWLRENLADGKWHDSGPLKERAGGEGISERTLKRAKQALRVEDRREGFPAVTSWHLSVGPGGIGPTGAGPTGPTSSEGSPKPTIAHSKPQLGQGAVPGPTAGSARPPRRSARGSTP
jgi:hypothetical protein